MFINRSLLTNVQRVDREMVIRCNAGTSRTDMVGELQGFPGEVWYNPDGIANILSLASVKKHCHAPYDSRCVGVFVVTKPDGSIREFRQSHSGLHYLKVGKDTNQDESVTLVTSIEDKRV